MAGGSRPARSRPTLELVVTCLVSALVLAFAWTRRNSGDIAAESGVGYAMGILGALLMLAVIVYPMRKRLPVLRRIGTIPNWFRLHMLLGVLGPVLIVIHSNFRLGSLNSRVALFAMLIVAGSGFVGRFLYTRIHRGLYGKKSSLPELLNELDGTREGASGARSDWRGMLEAYQAERLSAGNSFGHSLALTLTGPFSRSRLRRRLLAKGPSDPEARAALRRYLHSLGRAEAFALYERLFAAWHLFHLPLFFILVLAAITHVIAVHLY